MKNEPKFVYNPNEKIVAAIKKRLVATEGVCPCVHDGDAPVSDLMCPCKAYREKGKCVCNLYIE